MQVTADCKDHNALPLRRHFVHRSVATFLRVGYFHPGATIRKLDDVKLVGREDAPSVHWHKTDLGGSPGEKNIRKPGIRQQKYAQLFLLLVVSIQKLPHEKNQPWFF